MRLTSGGRDRCVCGIGHGGGDDLPGSLEEYNSRRLDVLPVCRAHAGDGGVVEVASEGTVVARKCKGQ